MTFCTALAISPRRVPSPVTDSASVSAWSQAALIRLTAWLTAHQETGFFTVSAVGAAVGGAGWLTGHRPFAEVLWIAVTVLGLAVSASWTVAAVRARTLGVDVIAVLALVGALAVGEPFAGAVIAVMLASGVLLEARAGARARRELRLLVERAPRTARRREGDRLVTVPVDDVRQQDSFILV